MQKNIVKNIAFLSAICLAQKFGNNPDINGANSWYKEDAQRNNLCPLSCYPVALCTQ